MKSRLPEPTKIEKEYSLKLCQHIQQEIVHAGGKIPFAQFMQLALYAPGLGYYSAGKCKLGESGDFVTAPIISPLFSQCIANQCREVLQTIKQGSILEFGAGNGIMAADILLHLDSRQCLPEHYFILEVSPDLKEIQQQTLTEKCAHIYDKIIWLDKLPEPGFKGIILANEVIDAFPVHKFCLQDDTIFEYFVAVDNNQFVWQLEKPSSRHLQEKINYLKKTYHIDDTHYESEINLMLDAWINSLSDLLNQGLVLLIDYGFPGREYYHPERSMGTIMCHYKHHAHTQPLSLIGLQDITSHVDFTAIAKAGFEAGFDINGYTNQASFLINCGLAELVSSTQDPKYVINNNKQIKLLTLPQEMGELFKTIALSKNLEMALMGFKQGDKTNQL